MRWADEQEDISFCPYKDDFHKDFRPLLRQLGPQLGPIGELNLGVLQFGSGAYALKNFVARMLTFGAVWWHLDTVLGITAMYLTAFLAERVGVPP